MTDLSVLIDRAMDRGIGVVEMGADEWAVTMRGALTIVDGGDELRAQLHRMGVRAAGDANGWAEYEARKRAWVAIHRCASGTAYQQAMRRIADELGL